MPVQSAPKEVDPGDVALSPDHEICEEIYQRVLTEVRARIDQRIADIEAQAVSLPVEAGDPAEDGEPRGLQQPPRRRPLLRAVVTLVASAGLVGAVVTLARDHRETIHSVTERIDAAVQAVRDSFPKAASGAGPEVATSATTAAVVAQPAAVALAPSTAPSTPAPEPPMTRSSDPSSAMAEAPPDRDTPPAPERDLVPLLDKIARDVTDLQTGLRELKASQDQASRDHSKAIEQLQASQDQLARAFRAAKNDAVGAATPARLPPRPPPPRSPRFP